MAALTIRWTRQAIADVDHLYQFIAADNPAAALAMIDRIDRAINSLVAHPRMGRAYRLRGRTVELLGVIHAARRWPESL